MLAFSWSQSHSSTSTFHYFGHVIPMALWLLCFLLVFFMGLVAFFYYLCCCFDRVFMLMFFMLLVALIVLFSWYSSWPSLQFF